MALTVERVILLRTVEFFARTDPDVLAAVAEILDEVHVSAGERVLTKGEVGTSMFIVVNGSVRVHDGETTLATFGRGQVFGELSALDPEQRNASVTAIEDTSLLRLEHDPLFDLMSERVEIAHAIIVFLVRRYGRGWRPHTPDGAPAPSRPR